MALYAAYGSNMDPAQMLVRCPHSPQRGTGWLEGWRLTFGGEDIGWDGALATVVEDPGARVFVVLYDVSEGDEKALDNWDGVTLGYYRKRQGARADPGRRRAGLAVRAQLLRGRAAVGAEPRHPGRRGRAGRRPADYVAALRALPCAKMGDSNTAYEGPEGAGGP